ncbi:MAG: hypothetical protein ABJJ37_05675 [Roseibium sp.]
MRGLYGLFIATIGFLLWAGPYALAGYGVYLLIQGIWSGLVFLLAAVGAYFLSRPLSGMLVHLGDQIVTSELNKKKSEDK